MVSKEYGWTDDVIMDLTVSRLRQILAAIERRSYLEQRRQTSLISWQTRQLATFIAAGYMTDGKKGNPAIKAAQSLAFDDIEAAQLEEAEIRATQQPRVTENKAGSFERFMGSMGSPGSWK